MANPVKYADPIAGIPTMYVHECPTCECTYVASDRFAIECGDCRQPRNISLVLPLSS